MKVLFAVFIVLVAGVIASRDLRSCGFCGMECENACGTRNFKTCCFNYMKKRSGGGDMPPIVNDNAFALPLDANQRLELWLAASRSPLYQRLLHKSAFGLQGLQEGRLTDADETAQILQQ